MKVQTKEHDIIFNIFIISNILRLSIFLIQDFWYTAERDFFQDLFNRKSKV